jgi:hypothetical protein
LSKEQAGYLQQMDQLFATAGDWHSMQEYKDMLRECDVTVRLSAQVGMHPTTNEVCHNDTMWRLDGVLVQHDCNLLHTLEHESMRRCWCSGRPLHATVAHVRDSSAADTACVGAVLKAYDSSKAYFSTAAAAVDVAAVVAAAGEEDLTVTLCEDWSDNIRYTPSQPAPGLP